MVLGVAENKQMVDIHCHVLPGVDDGAKSIQESLEILRRSAASGVGTVVATPHLLKGVYEVNYFERKEMTAELQQLANESGIDIQVKVGVECYLSPEILKDIDKLDELTINNNGKYILVELPMQIVPSYAEEVLFNLSVRGIVPILAHPERNMMICRKPGILSDFIEKGVIVQLNAGSILGVFGRRIRKMAQILLTQRLVHVVASDMHSARSSTLDQALPMVEKLLGSERASRMFIDAPGHIVAGEAFEKEPPLRPESERRGLRGIFFGHKE